MYLAFLALSNRLKDQLESLAHKLCIGDVIGFCAYSTRSEFEFSLAISFCKLHMTRFDCIAHGWRLEISD